MFEPTKTPSLFAPPAETARPLSQATDNFYTEFEDDNSEVEEHSLRSSNESVSASITSVRVPSSHVPAQQPKTK